MSFFRLKYTDKYKDVDYAEGTDWEGIKCPVYDGHQRAGKRIGDLRIEITSKKINDFMWTFFSELIINDKVVQLFKENDIQGYELQPVEVVNMELPYKFWEVIITGSAGIAPEKSGMKLERTCEYCGSQRYSELKEPKYLVDQNQWDGSDIFKVLPTAYIFVTGKVVDLIKKEKLTGVKIIPIEKLLKN
jgi:hypothetical protein